MQISAAVTRAKGGPMVLESLELAEPRSDELLVRIVASGICHADLFIRDQVYPVAPPIVLGHEGAGVVVRVGDAVQGIQPGDHVALSYNWCGDCASCVDGQPNYCHDFYARNFAAERPDGSSPLATSDGSWVRGYFFGQSSFATHVVCAARVAVLIDKDAPLHIAAPMACGVQTGAGAVLEALRVPAGGSLAIFGVGAVGMSAVLAARLGGVGRIVAVDIEPGRLELAGQLGATTVIDAAAQDVAEAIAHSGGAVEYALDTTGAPDVIRTAFDSLAPRGVCGTVGGNSPDTEVSVNLIDLMASGRTLRGIVEGDVTPRRFIPRLLDLYQQGRFPIDRIVTTYRFEDIATALDDVEAGRVIKPVLLHEQL